MSENGGKAYVTNSELKAEIKALEDEIAKLPTKFEVLFYIATATLAGRFIPTDAPQQVTSTVISWLF